MINDKMYYARHSDDLTAKTKAIFGDIVQDALEAADLEVDSLDKTSERQFDLPQHIELGHGPIIIRFINGKSVLMETMDFGSVSPITSDRIIPA